MFRDLLKKNVVLTLIQLFGLVISVIVITRVIVGMLVLI